MKNMMKNMMPLILQKTIQPKKSETLDEKNKKIFDDIDYTVDGIACNNNCNMIIGFNNKLNLLYIGNFNNHNKKWYFRTNFLPTLYNNKWSKIYLLEVDLNKYNAILMGEKGNIYISTHGINFAQQNSWILISSDIGNDIAYSDNYHYIYIATNKGVLINYNNGTMKTDKKGCIFNDCQTDYTNYEEQEYTFKKINHNNVINKNISNISCTPDGNIIIIEIKNEGIEVGKILKEKNGKCVQDKLIYDKQLRNDKEWWDREGHTIKDDHLPNCKKEGHLIWNFYKINNDFIKSNNCNSLIVLEYFKKGYVICGNDNGLYTYKYNKDEDDRLEGKNSEKWESLDKIKGTNELELPEYLVSKILVYKTLTANNIYAIINNLYIYYKNGNNKYFKRFETTDDNIIIKDMVISKSGKSGIILGNNNRIYINEDLRNYFNDKSTFEKIIIEKQSILL